MIAAWTFIVWLFRACTPKPPAASFTATARYAPTLSQIRDWNKERLDINPALRRMYRGRK